MKKRRKKKDGNMNIKNDSTTQREKDKTKES